MRHPIKEQPALASLSQTHVSQEEGVSCAILIPLKEVRVRNISTKMPSVGCHCTEGSQMEIIIVGCGFAGLACAIECTRKGLRVTVLEKHGPADILGESLVLMSSEHQLIGYRRRMIISYRHALDSHH